MQGKLDIALAAQRLGYFFGLPITNTLVAAWTVMAVLIIVAIIVGRRPQLVPGKVQNLFEMLFEFLLGYMQDVLGTRELAERYFPLIVTIFIFIFTSNLFDFLPFFGSVGLIQDGVLVPLFRPVNTDLNVTLALAIISVISIEVAGIVTLGVARYAGKFFNFRGTSIPNRLLNFTVGIIELISELSRFISFSFRLFGNVFAGEVLLAVAGLFLPYIVPVPLLLFELFVGFIQATVFAMLTLFFIKLAITDSHPTHESHA